MKAMKKIILLCSLVGGLYTGIWAQTQEVRWQKAEQPVWQSKRDTTVYWYTLDTEGKLALTTDNQKWVIATQPQWTSYEGRLYLDPIAQ